MNILLITTDEQTFTALGCNNNEHIHTPHLDRLAAQGVNFTRHSCSNPVCTPARVSLLTGQYSRTHGAVSVGHTFEDNEDTLSHCLSHTGYRCGFIGKAHFEPEQNGYVENLPDGTPYYGFHDCHITEDIQNGEYIRWVQNHHPQWLDEVRRIGHEDVAGTWGVEDGRLKSCFTSALPEEIHQTSWISERSLDLLRQYAQASQPFFLWASYVAPHHPWTPLEKYAALYDPEELPDINRATGAHGGAENGYNDGSALPDAELKRMQAAYFALISQLDANVGQLLEELTSLGLEDETMVIFTSDHGDYNGQRGLIRKGARFYDDVLRVPMLVRLPNTEASSVYDGPTQHEDLAPTILGLLNIDIPAAMQGCSLAGVLRGEPATPRKHSFFEGKYCSIVGVADHNHKLVFYNFGEQRVLTCASDDPLELKNLIGEEHLQGKRQELENALLEWLVQTKPWLSPKTHGY